VIALTLLIGGLVFLSAPIALPVVVMFYYGV
jgi:hypothetical protein